MSGTVVAYQAGSGEANGVVVSGNGSQVTIGDSGGATAGLGCSTLSSSSITCSVAATAIDLSLGDRNDSVNALGAPVAITVDAGAGDDILIGSTHDDVLIGGIGADTLHGGTGHDAVSYADRDAGQPVTVSLAIDDTPQTVAPGEADDISGEISRLIGGSGDDKLTGDEFDNLIDGGNGDDLIDGSAGADSVIGGAGSDTADFSARNRPVSVDVETPGGDGEQINTPVAGGTTTVSEGDDVHPDVERLVGGAAGDELHGRNGGAVLDGGDGDDLLYGGSGADVLADSGDDDTFTTFGNGISEDVLSGGAGNDLLEGGEGGDALIGGSGSDIVSYQDHSTPVSADIGLAPDGAPGEGDLIDRDVESLVGGPGDDTLAGDDGSNVLVGLGGDDELRGIGGVDTLLGGGGDDRIDGGADADLSFGEQGDDTLTGGSGDDRLDGGVGDDDLIGGSGDDRLDGGDGSDVADYSDHLDPVVSEADGLADSGAPALAEHDTVGTDVEGATGGSASDLLIGGDGPGPMRGGSGDDRLDGRGGADLIDGGEGSDLASYAGRTEALSITLDGIADDGALGEGDDVRTERIAGGAGDDTIVGSPGADALGGGAGADRIAGGDGPDKLFGHGGDDILAGDAGDDTLSGGGGTDRLVGGDGNDLLAGGDDDDSLDGSQGADELGGGGGSDTADYSNRSTAVDASIDGLANDGAAGENDDVSADTENLVGGSGPDTLTGDDGPNDVIGGAGADTLRGLAGKDHFAARDGTADQLDCGPDADRVDADVIDRLDHSCESATVMVASFTGRTAKLTKSGRLTVGLRCSAACAGTLGLRTAGKHRRSLGSKQFALSQAGTASLKLRLKRRALKTLRKARYRLAATLLVGGKTTHTTLRVRRTAR